MFTIYRNWWDIGRQLFQLIMQPFLQFASNKFTELPTSTNSVLKHEWHVPTNRFYQVMFSLEGVHLGCEFSILTTISYLVLFRNLLDGSIKNEKGKALFIWYHLAFNFYLGNTTITGDVVLLGFPNALLINALVIRYSCML